MKNAHCSHCGAPFPHLNPKWVEHKCTSCGGFTWNNPAPVGVMLIPLVNKGLEPAPFVGVLGIRRGEEPGKGELALPGGHLEAWESWQEGSAREVREEIKIAMTDKEVELFNVISTQNNYLIVFSTCKPRSHDIVKGFVPNHEVEELVILKEPVELTFPSHTQALEEFFERNKGKVRW